MILKLRSRPADRPAGIITQADIARAIANGEFLTDVCLDQPLHVGWGFSLSSRTPPIQA